MNFSKGKKEEIKSVFYYPRVGRQTARRGGASGRRNHARDSARKSKDDTSGILSRLGVRRHRGSVRAAGT